MKRILLFFGMCILLSGTPGIASADRQGFVNTVVIDPGHGGRDPGAEGKNSREKDINLAIALKLGNYINESMPDVKVIYTRKKDESVELFRRAQIANENHADLFISIHCNSVKGATAYGTETFVMGLHRSDANLEVARKENAAILYEEGYMETYEGYDPHSPVASIIFSLYQEAYLNHSLTMASYVQDQFRERAQRVDRGVKQAGFLVLYHVTMPGILVEAGFLSNPREEQYLLSESGQTHIASALFRAFRDYKTQQDALVAARKTNAEQPDTDTAKPNTEVISQQAPEQTQVINTPQQSEQKPAEVSETNLHPITVNETNIIFKVQFAVSSKQKPLNAPEFSSMEQADFYFHDGLYKYTSGNYKTFEEAAKQQAKLRNSGFSDAFVVAFRNRERIATVEAVKLVNQTEPNP